MMENGKDNKDKQDWRPGDRNDEPDQRYPERPRGEGNGQRGEGTIRDQMFRELNKEGLSEEAKALVLSNINNTLTTKFVTEKQIQAVEVLTKQVERIATVLEDIIGRMTNEAQSEPDQPSQPDQPQSDQSDKTD